MFDRKLYDNKRALQNKYLVNIYRVMSSLEKKPKRYFNYVDRWSIT